MLKVAICGTLLCCCILGLFVYSILRDDWLTYEYSPARYERSLASLAPPTLSGKMTASFSLWKGCIDIQWHSAARSVANLFQGQRRPAMCYEVAGYNDEFIELELKRLNLAKPETENVTSGINYTTTTGAPGTLGPDPFRTGFVQTAVPTTPEPPELIENTLPAINCPLPPDVLGASYQIDTPYEYSDLSFSRTTYSCKKSAYELVGARDYTLESFCVNGSWTTPPKCTPKDRCLPSGEHWDICVTGRAWDPVSIVKAIGESLPINATETTGFGTFIFPEYSIDCDGIIRQWDVYANFSGTVHLSVWKPVDHRYYFIAKNTVKSDGTGLQGFVIKPLERILVRKGYVLGVSYDFLIGENNSAIVQVYNAVDINQANPKLDWTKMHYSQQAFMVNVTQKWVQQRLFIDIDDRRLVVKRMAAGKPVIPIIAAYITGAVLTPINYSTVQALMVLAAMGSFISIVSLLLFIIFLGKKKDNWLGGSIQAAIFLNLFACTSGINGVVLLIEEYDCNLIVASYGNAIYIAFAAVGLAGIGVVILCIADRRLLTEISRKQYKIVVKPPSALA